MSNVLLKAINQTYVPGTPGVAGSPGQAAQSARTVYQTTTVCGWVVAGGTYQWVLGSDGVYRYILVPNQQPGEVGTYTSASSSYQCQQVSAPVRIPAVPYIAPVAAIPAIPSQMLQDYNLGWTGGARSIAALLSDGFVQFTVPNTVIGVFAGLNGNDAGPGYLELDHALYFARGIARVYESGIEKHYSGPHTSSDVFRIRRMGGQVTYAKNDTVFYTSTEPSLGEAFLDTSMYSGGDSLASPMVVNEFTGASATSFMPLYATGGDAAVSGGDSTFEPLVLISRAGVGGDSTFEALTGSGADRSYGWSEASFLPLAGLAEGNSGGFLLPSFGISDNSFMMLDAWGTGLTGEIGGGASTFESLTGSGSEGEYAESRASFEPLTGYAHAYEGSGNATLFAAAQSAAWFTSEGTLGAIMNSSGQITGVFAAEVSLLASAMSSALATSLLESQAELNAFMLTLVEGTSVNPADTSTVWVVNAETKATTRYENYSFNSFAKIGQHYYGAKSDGVYRLDGDTDSGDPVQAMVSFGKQNFGTSARKIVPECYLGMAGGRMFLKVMSEGQSYTYAARSADTEMRTQRITLGKGLRVNYLEFELYNADGEDFDLDTVEFMPVALSRRI